MCTLAGKLLKGGFSAQNSRKRPALWRQKHRPPRPSRCPAGPLLSPVPGKVCPEAEPVWRVAAFVRCSKTATAKGKIRGKGCGLRRTRGLWEIRGERAFFKKPPGNFFFRHF